MQFSGVRCETSTSLRQSFAGIAIILELDGAVKNGHFEENLMKALVWLKRTRKNWLLMALLREQWQKEHLEESDMLVPLGRIAAETLLDRPSFSHHACCEARGQSENQQVQRHPPYQHPRFS